MEDINRAIGSIYYLLMCLGQFPRWLADTTTSGRINPAFISEYVPTSALLPNQQPHSSNESPNSPSPNMLNHLRRRPPVPLGVGESHFVFPSPVQQHQFGHARKAPAPAPTQMSDEQSPSFLSSVPTFTLAKPPASRKKLPAADPQKANDDSTQSETVW